MLNKESFILGMVTAFCECVAGGCKQLALSPPLTREDYTSIAQVAEEIIEKHGLLHYHEENLDLPEAERVDWILIAAREETFEQYRRLRTEGFNPVRSLKPFHELLSYNASRSVHTGYDAYRSFFPQG